MGILQEYKKTASRSMMTGDWFEVKMAALIYLRSLSRYKAGSLRHFKLATNVDDTGAFDDIVYSVGLSDNTTHTVLMQLKHKGRAHLSVDTFASESGDFSLRKYLKSYIEVKNNRGNSNATNSFLLEGPFDNFQFVIYTTAPLKKRDKVMSKVTSVTEEYLENLFLTNVGQQLIYKFKTEERENVISFASGEEYMQSELDDFFLRLVLYTGQKSETELDDLIKKELNSLYNEAAGKEEPLYRILEGYFKQWWRDDKGEVLDETNDILQRVLSQLSFETDLMKQTKRCTLDVKFNEMIPEKKCITFSGGLRVIHIVSPGRSLKLPATKILQFLQNQQMSFIFVSLEYLILNSTSIIPEWKNGHKYCLAIIVDNTVTYEPLSVRSVFDTIQNTINEMSTKNILILSRKNCKVTERLVNGINKSHIKTFPVEFHFSQLESSSQDEILKKKVLYKNEELELQSLFDKESLKKLLTDDLIDDLLSKENVKIEGRLPVVIPHFIPRRLCRSVLEQDILKAKTSSDVFAVSGVTLGELQKLVDSTCTESQDNLDKTSLSRPSEENGSSTHLYGNMTRVGVARNVASIPNLQFFVLSPDRAQEEYEMMVTVKPNVHWICIENSTIQWIKSSGNRAIIEKYTTSITIDEDNFSKQESKVDIILGEPGMGKSTFIPKLAQLWKMRNLNDIIVEINLSQHLKLLAEQKTAFNFLVESLGLSSTMERSYLKSCLYETGHIIILVDSFDEACPLYQHEACKLLCELLETKAKKVIVTSRQCMEDVLKQHLVTSPYNLLEFSVGEQREFFAKYFGKTTEPGHVKETIAKILNSLGTIDPGGRLLGIPLQTFMIAEIFYDYMKDPVNNDFPDHLDIITLFEKFIDTKFKIYFSKNKDMAWTKEELRVTFFQNHTYASFLCIFSKQEVLQIVTDEKIIERANFFFSKIDEGRDSAGLVSRVIDKKPIFIHLTFAEYLVALWFANHYKSNRHFLMEHLLKSSSNVIRIMFDRILAKGHILHESVLNQDIVRVERLLSSGTVDLHAKDKGGRSAVHLASGLGFNPKRCGVTKTWRYTILDTRFIGPRERHITELLLEHGSAVDKRDDVFQWTPLDYALNTNSWDAAEYLLAAGAKTDKGNKSFRFLSYCNIGHINLFIVHCLKNVIAFFLLSNSSLLDKELVLHTLLQNACLVGDIDTVQVLLTKIECTAGNRIFCCCRKNARVSRCIENANANGDSAFSLACECKHSQIVQLFLSHGANIYATNKDGNTCLHFACISGGLPVVNAIIEEVEQTGDSVERYINTRNRVGKTPLCFACRYRNYEVVVRLIACGADFCAVNNLGDSCIHVSCLGGDTSIVQLLINCMREKEYPVEELVNAGNKSGETPLALACLMGHSEVIKVLGCNGANLFACDRYRNTILHHASTGGNADVIDAVLETLRKNEVSTMTLINSVNVVNESALSRACRYRYYDIVQNLLASDASVYFTDADGNSCLHKACQSGDMTIVTMLIEFVIRKGESVTAFINTVNDLKETPMIVACKYHYFHIPTLLLSHKADIFAVDDKGRSCMHYICSGGATSLAKAVIERVTEEGRSVGEFIDQVNWRKQTSLMLSCYFGHSEVAQLLVSHGADVQPCDEIGNTCLHYACMWKYSNLVKAILDKGGEKDALNVREESPYTLACKQKHSSVIDLFHSYTNSQL